MEEQFDEHADIYHAVNRFDEDVDTDALMARVDRLQGLIAKREPTYAAAVEAYNAALRAAYDQFQLVAGEYHRASERVSELSSVLTFVMRVRDEANEGAPGWDQSREGRQLQRFIEIWEEFENVVDEDRGTSLPSIKPRKKLLSGLIAALPRKPEEIELPEVGRTIDPKVKASVESSWKRIDAWLAANSPALARKMNPGATPESILRVEASLGIDLPEAVRASYLVHDGSTVIGIFPPGEYSTLDDMARNCLTMREGLGEGYFDGFENEFVGVGPIKRAYYHPAWIPMTDNSGCFTFIDLAPEGGGVVGQLINFLRDDGPQDVAAPGLAEYLAHLADGLEAGAARIEDDSCLVWDIGPYAPREGKAPPEAPSTNTPATEPGKRYFEFKEGSSSKFWEVSQQGSEMTTRYGKIGTKGQTTTKSFGSPEKAATEAAKVTAKKLKEGYVEGRPSGTADPGIPPAEIPDPGSMLSIVQPTASGRKRRLFAVACCRHVEFMIDWAFEYRDDHYRVALETSEQFADGRATVHELGTACDDADDSWFINLDHEYCAEDEPWGDPFRDVASEDPAVVDDIWRMVLLVVRECGLDPDQAGPKRRHDEEERAERSTQAALFREIFGDPYPPPAFDPAWRTPAVVAIAEGIYADKAFDRMPILADALEDAGCPDTAILSHCRGTGPHVRGCWVLDSILGKE